jgi:hypothetical protein
VKALTRPYLMASQGTLLNMRFHDATMDFLASFIANTSISLPTVAYLNLKYWYPSGLRLQVSSGKTILKLGTDYTLDTSSANYYKILITNTSYNG